MFCQPKTCIRAASVKSNAKFSHLVPSFRNTSSTVCRIILLFTLLLLSSGRHSIRNVSFGKSKLPTSTLTYFCLATSASSTIKKTFFPEVVLEYSPLFEMLIEQRLHGLQFQRIFPLQQTEISKQDDLVYEVEYLQRGMKRLFFP